MVDATNDLGDEGYYDRPKDRSAGFDAFLIREPLRALPVRPAIVFPADATVTDAMRAMQREHRGCVIVTDDGTQNAKLVGIFTERDVLFRIVDRGRNPQDLPLSEVMTTEPEALPLEASLAWVLNKMAVGGFRHVPVVDEKDRPAFVISVRDVVEFLVDFFPNDVLNLPPEYGPPRSTKREGA